MRLIASDDRYNWLELDSSNIQPKILTQLNVEVNWCECPQCMSKRIYSIQYLPRHYGYYCTECKLAYRAERIQH